MATPLRPPQLLRLASRRWSPPFLSRGLVSIVAADRGGLLLVPSQRWTTADDASPAHYSRSPSLRSFSTTSKKEEQEEQEPNNKTAVETIKQEEEEGESVSKQKKDIPKESLQFQAETRQLLDIVTHSLYTEKEVFLRELVSNASDALEKLRHLQVANVEGMEVAASDAPLEIRIETDEANQTLTITDTGVGLTKQDMISNLGTIAKSGSRAFLNEISNATSKDPQLDPAKGIIGKFGVGFYSAFMVGNKVDVRSRSAYESHKDETPKLWSSEGVGTFDIGDLDDSIRQDRGTSVVIYLKDENIEYCDEKVVKRILKKYSNFVNFPIYLNGNRVNTMEAVWAKHPKDVDEKTYTAFYKFIAKAFDEPLDRLHFRADAPLEVKALFYIPSFHSEKYGMTRMEPGVSLYSRKVLIESQSPDILPDWMRFVKGVVDSEDLPLSLSREKPQDSALIAKLRKALTRKFISHLSKMAKKRSDVYKDEFYNEYNIFLKEGICQDFEFQQPLSKLLYFETNKGMNKDMVSLDEYVARCPPEQKEIYYLCAPSRSLALESPYLEAFERTGREVIFAYTAMDDFVLANLEKYEGRPLVSVEKGNIDLGSKSEEKNADDGGVRLDDKQAVEFCDWFKTTLGDKKVASCKVTNRLGASPAVVVDSESGAMRRMMRMLDTTDPGRETDTLPKQQVEINPAHPVIIGIYNIRQQEPTLAKVLAEQVFDNCLMAAGLLDDGRSMLPRLNDLMAALVKDASSELPPSSDAPEDSDTSGDSSESDSSDEESEDEENFKDEESEDEEKVKDEEAEDEEKVKDEESKDEEKVTDEESEDEEKVEDEETKDEEKVKDEESKDEEKVKEEASSK